MTSPPQPGPRRQDSTVSSTSSSNRTIRASSQSGRRRSPTSTSTSTATGLLARLTGRSNGKKLEDSSFGSEDEELMSMHGSRNSPPGLQAKTSRDEGLEAGPSDYWRRTPSLQGSPISLPVTGQEGVLAVWSSTAQDHSTGVWHPTASSVWPAHPTPPTDLGETIRRRTAIPDGERFDNIEYERRMRDLLAHPAERINGTGLHKLDSHDGNIAISRKPGFGDLEGQLEEGFRDVVDLANGADHSGRELEEEEIGVHAIPPKVGPFPHIIRAAQFASRMAYRKGQFPRLLSLSPVEKSY